MRKQITCILCAIMLCLGLLPVKSAAAPDIARECSLTLHYTQESIAFPDLDVEIYRVAKLLATGKHELIEPFSSYPVNIQGIRSQKEWRDVADTLSSYIEANQVLPYLVVPQEFTSSQFAFNKANYLALEDSFTFL